MAARALVLALGLAWVASVAAQSPAVSAPEAAEAKTQANQQLAQPLNNQPLWKEIPKGH